MDNRNMPAMPLAPVESIEDHGMSKLEYAAIQAMQGMLSNPGISDQSDPRIQTWVAQRACEQAKALFDELEQQP